MSAWMPPSKWISGSETPRWSTLDVELSTTLWLCRHIFLRAQHFKNLTVCPNTNAMLGHRKHILENTNQGEDAQKIHLCLFPCGFLTQKCRTLRLFHFTYFLGSTVHTKTEAMLQQMLMFCWC